MPCFRLNEPQRGLRVGIGPLNLGFDSTSTPAPDERLLWNGLESI